VWIGHLKMTIISSCPSKYWKLCDCDRANDKCNDVYDIFLAWLVHILKVNEVQ